MEYNGTFCYKALVNFVFVLQDRKRQSPDSVIGPDTMMDCSVSPDSVIGPGMGSQRKDKTCLVCGDKALGYNFNAVSCESCKAFFRRNAHKVSAGVKVFRIMPELQKIWERFSNLWRSEEIWGGGGSQQCRLIGLFSQITRVV